MNSGSARPRPRESLPDDVRHRAAGSAARKDAAGLFTGPRVISRRFQSSRCVATHGVTAARHRACGERARNRWIDQPSNYLRRWVTSRRLAWLPSEGHEKSRAAQDDVLEDAERSRELSSSGYIICLLIRGRHRVRVATSASKWHRRILVLVYLLHGENVVKITIKVCESI